MEFRFPAPPVWAPFFGMLILSFGSDMLGGLLGKTKKQRKKCVCVCVCVCRRRRFY